MPQPDASTTLKPGTTIAGYEIVRALGQGGFGITYEAVNNVVKRRVAIKEFFPLGVAARQDGTRVIFPGDKNGIVDWALKRFQQSTSALAGLDHPNIIDVMNYVSDHGTGYMVMEHVDGDTLDSWLRKRKTKPSLDELKTVLDPIWDALEYMHKNNLLHRDIAPDNIMLRKNGEPALIDFGAIKSIEVETRALVGGSISFDVWKPHYSSPEQSKEKAHLDARADIYSIGAVLYRALTGQPPADARHRQAELATRDPDPLLPMLKMIPQMPEDIAAVIDAALSMRREERPKGVGLLRYQLGWTQQKPDPQDDIVTEKGSPLPPLPPPLPPEDLETDTGKEGRRWPRMLIAAAGILLVIGIGTYFTRNQPPPKPKADQVVVPPRSPQAISGESAVFFNPATGNAAVWFSQSASGDYEFFDADGYHPRTGEKLRPVDRQIVDDWHRREEAKKKPKLTLADGHIACKTRYGENSYATSIDEGSSAPYRCGCNVGYVWNANNTSCIVRTQPLVERIAPSRWAVGGSANCNVPGRVYSLILSASDNMTWLEGTGAQYIERIVFSGDQEFHTQTIRSASGDAPGTNWVYRSAGTDRIQIFKERNSPLIAVRCP